MLAIYVLLGGFALMFLYGKRSGVWLLLGLSAVLIIAHTAFAVMDLTGVTDAGLHGVANNPWPTVPQCVFFLAKLGFGVKALYERPGSREGSRITH